MQQDGTAVKQTVGYTATIELRETGLIPFWDAGKDQGFKHLLFKIEFDDNAGDILSELEMQLLATYKAEAVPVGTGFCDEQWGELSTDFDTKYHRNVLTKSPILLFLLDKLVKLTRHMQLYED